MRVTLKVIVVWGLLTGCSIKAEGQAVEAAVCQRQTVQAFVQGFYDWYLAKGLSDAPGASWRHVRTEMESSFSPALVRALDDDAAAQAAVRGVTVGLDFDPFLASQDPDDRYQVGEVVPKGTEYLVSVHRIQHGKPRAASAVVAEVGRANGHLQFINFKYAQDHDLLNILKSLAEVRSKKN